MAKKSNNKNLDTAKKVVKEVAPTKSQIKRGMKKSGFHRAVPYLTILFALVLAICFFTVRLLELNDGAGVVGYYIQLFFCGLFGGAAFLIPLGLGFVGVLWCMLHFKEASPKPKSDEDASALRKTRRRTVSKTVLTFVFILLFSSLLGVFAGYDDLDVAELFTDGGEKFAVGGIVGSSIGWLFNYAFSTVLSSIILIIALLVVLLFAVGITPDYIANKIRMSRELRAELDAEDNSELEAARYEELRKAELERARKKRAKQLEAKQKKQLRAAAEADDEEYYENDEPELIPPETVSTKRTKKSEPLPDTDELLDGIGVDEEIEVIEEPVMTTIVTDPVTEYGGDPAIDGDDSLMGGDTVSADALLSDLKKNAASEHRQEYVKTEKPAEDIALGTISSDTLSEDLAGVTLEEGKAEEEPEEIVTPYIFPPVDMLAENKNPTDVDVSAELQENARILKETLKSFKVDIREINYSRGPTITRYELRPEVGTRVRAIANLVDDIALSLATSGVRIEAPIPNKPAVGIEVPNRVRATVYLRDLIENPKFTDSKSRISSCLGMDVGGNPVYFDVGKMPHLLIAGTTGSGKSVCINTIILSILYKARPDEVKLILIDPKQVEFTMYEGIPHLYCPIVSEPKKAAGALASAVSEMERRFELIRSVGVRNIDGYNEITANDPSKEYMPKMVIIIDELADLMMTARDEVETSICRLAQKARAAGIHVILGTQRPSVDVITGLIKANVPSRIACTVTSQIDSRTIIDTAGAENLIGYGDMLFAPVGAAKPIRVQGAFVSDGEIENIVSFIKENNSTVKYNAEFISSMEENAKLMAAGKKGGGAAPEESTADDGEDLDPKFNDAVLIAVQEGKIATSLLQRKLGVGYGRAAKIIDAMEVRGYVSKADGTKPRRTLLTMAEYQERSAQGSLGDRSAPSGDLDEE